MLPDVHEYVLQHVQLGRLRQSVSGIVSATVRRGTINFILWMVNNELNFVKHARLFPHTSLLSWHKHIAHIWGLTSARNPLDSIDFFSSSTVLSSTVVTTATAAWISATRRAPTTDASRPAITSAEDSAEEWVLGILKDNIRGWKWSKYNHYGGVFGRVSVLEVTSFTKGLKKFLSRCWRSSCRLPDFALITRTHWGFHSLT